MGITYRTLAREEFPSAERMAEQAFLGTFYDDEEHVQPFYDSQEPSRFFAALDDDRIVGTAATLTRQMGVPGGISAVGAVTGVAVARTHRRRGVLTELMRRQLDDAAGRGEPLAILFASEATIYGRFGYAAAAPRVELAIDLARAGFNAAGRAALAAWDGSLSEDASLAVRADVATVVDAVAALTPGVMTRPDIFGRRVSAASPARLGGDMAQRTVLARDASGAVVGFARYTGHGAFTGQVATGSIAVREVMALTLPAEAALWRFLLDVDLASTATASMRPYPDPLWQLLADPRRTAPTVGEGLWVRVLDLPSALAERRFAADVDLVLDVVDGFRPDGGAAGRWRVRAAADGGATVTRAPDAAPDLMLPVGALGAAHLGSETLATVARGGEIAEHTPGALVAASRAWGWHVPAWAPEMF